MIRGMLQLMLGRYGRALLAFYNQYNLLISPFVVLYGVVTIYAHNNLRKVIRQMESMMLEIVGEMGEEPDHLHVLQRFSDRWKAEQGERRLFFPTKSDFWFGYIDTTDLVDLLHVGPDYVKMVLHKHLKWPRRAAFHPVDYGVWEGYRHRLLIGIRSKLPDIEEAKRRYREKQRERAKEQKTRSTRKK